MARLDILRAVVSLEECAALTCAIFIDLSVVDALEALVSPWPVAFLAFRVAATLVA